MNIDWAAIIELVIQLLANCPDQATADNLRKMNWRHRVHLQAALRRAGYRRDEVNQVFAEWGKCCSASSSGDLPTLEELCELSKLPQD